MAQSKIFWLAAQVIVFILCVAYIQMIYHKNIAPDQRVSDTFTQTQCTLLSKHLAQAGKLTHRYRADFQLRYSVAEKIYQSTASANGLDLSFTSDRTLEENQLNQFQLGRAYPCWVDPNAPQTVVLVQRHNWSSTFQLFIPAVLAIVMLYFIMRTLFTFRAVSK